jgi:hypothetical protein
MDLQTLHAEAEECRKNAKCYVGKPEASFLLRLAEAFEQLRAQQDETNTSAATSFIGRSKRRVAVHRPTEASLG